MIKVIVAFLLITFFVLLGVYGRPGGYKTLMDSADKVIYQVDERLFGCKIYPGQAVGSERFGGDWFMSLDGGRYGEDWVVINLTIMRGKGSRIAAFGHRGKVLLSMDAGNLILVDQCGEVFEAVGSEVEYGFFTNGVLWYHGGNYYPGETREGQLEFKVNKLSRRLDLCLKTGYSRHRSLGIRVMKIPRN